MRSWRLLIVLTALIASAFSACSGGGAPTAGIVVPTSPPSGAGTPVGSPTPVASPSPVASMAPVASASPVASTAPTQSATSSSGSITLTHSSLMFNATGYEQSFAASETGYTGSFAASSSNCNGIATLTTTSASPPSFTVMSVAAGTCQFSVTDASGNAATETITVTTTGGSIS